MSIEKEIKFLNGDDLIKLEEYLNFVAKNESGNEYFFKFNDERNQIIVTQKNNIKKVVWSINEFVTKLKPNLKIFLKFKDNDKITEKQLH